MTSQTTPKTLRCGNSQILFDAERLQTPDENLFSTDWLKQHASIQPTTSGRGESWFVEFKQADTQTGYWVLRHYLRGGMVAKFNRDLYLAWQAEQTRAWKEWRLLSHMRTLGLPVPQPVAALAHWPAGCISGLYRADILLEKIPHCHTLSNLLQQQSLPEELWYNIGQCLKTFHTHDIYHADLNANNILIDAQQKIHLIDFDRCRISTNKHLIASNLPRLQRSLLKLQGLHPVFNFTNQNWLALLSGYAESSAS